MDGNFNYKAIREKLLKIYKQLEDEWQIEWIK